MLAWHLVAQQMLLIQVVALILTCEVYVAWCRTYLREFYQALGDDVGAEERERQRKRLLKVMESVGIDAAEEEETRLQAAKARKQQEQQQEQQQQQQVAEEQQARVRHCDSQRMMCVWLAYAAPSAAYNWDVCDQLCHVLLVQHKQLGLRLNAACNAPYVCQCVITCCFNLCASVLVAPFCQEVLVLNLLVLNLLHCPSYKPYCWC